MNRGKECRSIMHTESLTDPCSESSSKKGEFGAASVSGTTRATKACDLNQALTEVLFDSVMYRMYFLNDGVSVEIYILEADGPIRHSESHLKSHRYYQAKPFSKPEYCGAILD